MLGQQQANAREAERLHRAKAVATEPLVNTEYGAGAGDLLNIVDSPVDDLISNLADRYRGSDSSDRESIRASLTMDDFYKITLFARRSAARTLSNATTTDLVDGLTAVATIASERIDARDISWAAAYLRIAGLCVTEPETLDGLFERAANLAEPTTSKILRSFLRSNYDDICGGWLMRVTEYEGRKVIVETGKGRFEPTFSVLDLASDLKQILGADGYETGNLVVGGTIHSNWLGGSPGSEEVLNRSVASVRVTVLGRPELPPMAQLFLAHIFELASNGDATVLERAWTDGVRHFASLVVVVKKLAVVIISNSSLAGVDTIESDEALHRFQESIADVLARHQR